MNTHTSDQIIDFFALFAFSSSHQEIRYRRPLIINAITAIAAIYWINWAIKLLINHVADSTVFEVLIEHPGSHSQSILGAAANVGKNEKLATMIKNIFFINFSFYKE